MKEMEYKYLQHSTTTSTTTTSPSVCDDLVIPASSTATMESRFRNTEEREFEKERKRVRYVSAGLSAIFTFLFIVVLVSTIGLNWWYSLVICGIPTLLGGLLLLRRYVKETERRRLEMEAEIASAHAHVIVNPYCLALLHEQLQQYALQPPCAHCQHCEHSVLSNSTVPSSHNQPTNNVNSMATTTCIDDTRPPAYNLLYPSEGNSLPAAT